MTTKSGSGANLPYAVVPLTPQIAAQVLEEDAKPFYSERTIDSPQSDIRVGISDVLAVTIFEAEPGGLFLSSEAGARQGNYVQLPNEQVDQSGMITVPFAGRIKADGQTLAQIQGAIQSRLANRALEPQAIVTIADSRSKTVSVLGDVTTPLQFPIDPGGVRILTAIARAAGAKFPGYESTVVLKRDGRSERALLSDLVDNPGSNILMQPGDVVYVAHEPRYFIAMGATGLATSLGPVDRRFTFDDSKLTLADALGKAGGLEDDRADPSAVFLYRTETKAALQRMGLQVPQGSPDLIPTIYTVDMRDPAGLFLATKVPMHNEDIIYVSNAPSVELNKFLQTILPLTETIYEGQLIAK